jgi:hypothetical protein
MLKILTVMLIGMGLFILICGLYFKPLKITLGFGKHKLKYTKTPLKMLESIAAKRIIHKPLDYLSQNKEFWTNKVASRILELSEVGISLQQLYLLKFICLNLCILSVIVICSTNTVYQAKLIVETSREQRSELYQGNSFDQSRYLLYRQIIAVVGRNKLSNVKDSEVYYLVEKEIAEYLKTSDQQLIEEKANWFIKTWVEVQNLRVFSYYHILIIILAAFLPEFLLTLRWLLRGCVYKKEIIKLEYIFGLLARVDGIKTLDIIHELEKSSKIYSKYLHEFGTMYQYDKKSGFEYLKSRNIKSLSKIANVIEIYSLSNKELALQVLEREMMERDESIIITAEETIDFIDLVAFLSIIPLVYELARLMLNPMLDVVYRAFEFI